jgi:hypothetical protein
MPSSANTAISKQRQNANPRAPAAHAQTVEEVAAALGADTLRGLSEAEAQARLKENDLTSWRRKSRLRRGAAFCRSSRTRS